MLCAALPAHAEDFTAAVRALVSQTETAKPLAISGTAPGWFFLRKELEHLQVGDLATADLAKANKEGTDPLPRPA